jgi:hypothetical protein
MSEYTVTGFVEEPLAVLSYPADGGIRLLQNTKTLIKLCVVMPQKTVIFFTLIPSESQN